LGSSDEDKDFARYRDFGNMTGLIGNYLSKPKGPLAMEPIGEYRVTFYWIARELPHDGKKLTSILVRCPCSKEEHPTEVAASFKRRLDREGTGILEDGRLINVLRRGEKRRYLDISTIYPTGLGSRNNPLTPFISVAVSDCNPDLKFGDRIYIPKAHGIPLPNGGKHDGIFTVDDTGSGIASNQIDVFIFVKKNWLEFQRNLKAHRQRFFVYELFRAGREPSKSPKQQPANQQKSQKQSPKRELPQPNQLARP
jgi:3D (Asp-Asp-Asp) domain-containing protein